MYIFYNLSGKVIHDIREIRVPSNSYTCLSCQVVISSSGLTPDYQWTRLGYYSLLGELDSRPTYVQTGTSSPNYLYYLGWLGVWYVNDNLGENMVL